MPLWYNEGDRIPMPFGYFLRRHHAWEGKNWTGRATGNTNNIIYDLVAHTHSCQTVKKEKALSVVILNSLFPIFTLILLGGLLKKYNITNPVFLTTSDRLVYYIFFPILLFWKIGGASYGKGIDWNFCLASLSALLIMFFLSTLAIKVFRISDFQAGTFSQSSYRFNTYIGMAVILTSMGEEGIQYFGIVIGMAIPLINLFAVSILIWFSGEQVGSGKRWRLVLKSLVSNPLILGCLAGILYSRSIQTFPLFLDNTLRLMSMVTLPLALLSIGGSLSLSGFRKYLPLSLLAAILKLVVLPITGYFLFKLFHVEPIPFKVGMIFFTLPASTAIYVLSSQLNSDTELASSAILLSTVLSFFSLSIALLL